MSWQRRGASLVFVGLLATACVTGAPLARPRNDLREPLPRRAGTTLERCSVKPAARSEPGPAASTTAAPTPSPYGFQLVAKATDVWLLRGSVLIGQCQSTRIVRSEGPTLSYEPGLGRALAALAVNGQAPCVDDVDGRWPAPLWVTTRGVADRPRLYRFRDGALERVRDGSHAIHVWREGWLALEHVAPDDYRLEPLGTRKAPPLMRSDVMEKGRPTHRLHMSRAFTATTTGEVFVFGRDRKDGGWAVERWGSAGGRSTIEPLPPIAQDAASWDASRHGPWGTAHALSGSDVYAAPVPGLLAGDEAILLHFDGSTWTREDTADLSGPVTAIAGTAGGPLWLVAGRQLWRRAAPEPWQRVAIPARGSVHRVHVSSDGEVWVVTDSGVYRNRPAASAVNAYPTAPLPEASEDCLHPFVDLAEAPDGSDPSYDFPPQRQSFAGASELQGMELVDYVDHVGQRRLGAIVATMTMAREVVAIAGKAASIRCGRPEPLRVLDLDLRTGELR